MLLESETAELARKGVNLGPVVTKQTNDHGIGKGVERTEFKKSGTVAAPPALRSESWYDIGEQKY